MGGWGQRGPPLVLLYYLLRINLPKTDLEQEVRDSPKISAS